MKAKVVATYPDVFPDNSTIETLDQRPDLELPRCFSNTITESHPALRLRRFGHEFSKRANTAADPEVFRTRIQVKWRKPDTKTHKLNVDARAFMEAGAVTGNASVGGVVRDENGSWLRGFRGRIQSVSVMGAELHAIGKGIKVAWEMGIKKLQVEKNCFEALQSIKEATFSHRHFDIILSIRELLSRNWQINITHVWREANKVADSLAKTGLHRTFEILHQPVPEVDLTSD